MLLAPVPSKRRYPLRLSRLQSRVLAVILLGEHADVFQKVGGGIIVVGLLGTVGSASAPPPNENRAEEQADDLKRSEVGVV